MQRIKTENEGDKKEKEEKDGGELESKKERERGRKGRGERSGRGERKRKIWHMFGEFLGMLLPRYKEVVVRPVNKAGEESQLRYFLFYFCCFRRSISQISGSIIYAIIDT